MQGTHDSLLKRMGQKRWRLTTGGSLLVLALLVTGMLASCAGTPDSASQVQANKAVAGQVRNFKLYVRENTLKMPDGKQIYVFGYTDDPKGPAKIPGLSGYSFLRLQVAASSCT